MKYKHIINGSGCGNKLVTLNQCHLIVDIVCNVLHRVKYCVHKIFLIGLALTLMVSKDDSPAVGIYISRGVGCSGDGFNYVCLFQSF